MTDAALSFSHPHTLAPRFARFAAAISIGVAGAFVSIAMPGILLALSQIDGFSSERAAMFASVELGGMVASILFLGQTLNGRHRKTILATALIAIVAGNIASIFLYGTNLILLARFSAGLGEGIALGALGAAATAFPNPDRLFALFMSTNLGLVAAYLFFLPKMVLAGGIEVAFLALAGLGVAGLLALPYFPGVTAPAANPMPAPAKIRMRGVSAGAAMGLMGCLGLNAGVGMIWPFMGSLGEARGIPSETISTNLAMATFAGIAAGFCAALLGLRFGRRLPLGLATLVLVLSGAGLAWEAANYTLCGMMFVFSWTFATSYFMGTVAAAEDGERAAILIPAAQLAGLAVGPQLSAPIIAHSSLSWIVIGGGILCALSAISALFANSPRR